MWYIKEVLRNLTEEEKMEYGAIAIIVIAFISFLILLFVTMDNSPVNGVSTTPPPVISK